MPQKAKQVQAQRAVDRTEVAAYVASLSADLSMLARRNGLSTLAYLLDIARLEAEGAAREEAGADLTAGSGPGVEAL